MIKAGHIVIYSKDSEADRAFFRHVLGFPSVDAGDGWLIFALPPAEAAFHPSDRNGPHELYLVCDDLAATIAELSNKGVTCSAPADRGWGVITTMTLPGGGELGLYEPRHPMAVEGMGSPSESD